MTQAHQAPALRGRPQPVDTSSLLPFLSLITLLAVLLLLIGSFVYFLRKRRNRAAASHALGMDDDPRR